jgi:hypothetical protein
MTLFIFSNDDSEHLKLPMKYAASSWADIILMGLNDGKKPEIIIDRSGSMTSPLTTVMMTTVMSRMDCSRTIVCMVADVLSKRNKGFDLTQIPVKSFGSNIYSHGTLDDFLPANFKRTSYQQQRGPPDIPCTDGTNHDWWFKESNYPLVITDDFYNADKKPQFVINYENFEWCDGNNIIVIESNREDLRSSVLSADSGLRQSTI